MDALLNDSAIWLLCSFVIFAFLLWQKGKGAVVALLDKRIAEIKSELETAENLRVEAQELLAQYQRKHRDAVKDADKIIANAQASADEIRRKAEQDLSESLTRKEQQLRDRLTRAEQSAIQEIQEYAADLAIKATSEIIAGKLDKKTSEGLLDDSVKNISKNIH